MKPKPIVLALLIFAAVFAMPARAQIEVGLQCWEGSTESPLLSHSSSMRSQSLEAAGAIRCSVVTSGAITRETVADTDGDDRPDLVIHPAQGAICEP